MVADHTVPLVIALQMSIYKCSLTIEHKEIDTRPVYHTTRVYGTIPYLVLGLMASSENAGACSVTIHKRPLLGRFPLVNSMKGWFGSSLFE